MADLIKTIAIRDSGVTQTMTAAALTQTIVCYKDEKIAVIVTNGSGASITATIKKGTGIRSTLGDLVVTVPAGTTSVIGALDSMRFATSGKLALAISVVTSVTIGVIQLP